MKYKKIDKTIYRCPKFFSIITDVNRIYPDLKLLCTANKSGAVSASPKIIVSTGVNHLTLK